jgi:hypothetical protein
LTELQVDINQQMFKFGKECDIMSFQTELATVREKIINRTLFTVVVFMGVALITSVYRITEIGFHPIFVFHVFLATVCFALFIFRHSIPLDYKAHVFFVVVFINSIIGIYFFRNTGGAYHFPILIVVALIISGLRSTVIYSVIFMVSFIAIGYLHTNDLIVSNLNYNEYTSSKVVWINTIMNYLLTFVIIIDVLQLYTNLFQNSLKESTNK